MKFASCADTFKLLASRMNTLNHKAQIHKYQLLICLGILALIPNTYAADTPTVPAFPGAEGYGAITRGGRGGKVILVTNLNDSGPGSLREAVETEGPRIVVFTVSGTITLESRLTISNPYITIAGQTDQGMVSALRNISSQLIDII